MIFEGKESAVTDWHVLNKESVLEHLKVEANSGLSDAAVERRREEYGVNELRETGGRGPWVILWDQLRGAMILLLIVAALVSAYLEEYTDAVVILAIVILNALLGFVQEFRAEKAMEALKKLAVPRVRVRREGQIQEVSAKELVPGDVVLLEVGNQIPADCRLLESPNLKVQEAALTGESEAVEKTTDCFSDPDLPLGDRANCVFMGTVVTYGHGVGVVTETGMQTQLGKIASSLQAVEAEPTPLQRRLAQLGRTLAIVALGIVIIVFLMGLLKGVDAKLMLMTSLSLAVAVVPEGLPAVATVALALGARRMFKRNALIRKLPAVETLGSVTVICSDKTGTLTQNRMTVTALDVVGHRIDLPELLRHGHPMATINEDEGVNDVRKHVSESSSLSLVLTGAALCNDAELVFESDRQHIHAVGDPTEGAMVLAAAQLQLPADKLNHVLPRIDELPFDSERKRMTTIHEWHRSGEEDHPESMLHVLDHLQEFSPGNIAFTKGAVDSLLEVCNRVWDGNEEHELTQDWQNRIEDANQNLASQGMRILGVACRTVPSSEHGFEPASIENDLMFVGLIAMIDPARPEVREAVSRCRQAGIRPLMITGDHPLTAQSIAETLQITEAGGRVVSGAEIENLTDAELETTVKNVSVFARVAPKHKLRLVRALQENGEIVAMTGDGVNDAPALKQAHIGVAMGITGTDVAKESSQMVLIDDNFATIVNAVEEGRMVYDNVRKFVKYTMTSNAGEIWVMVLGPVLGMPLPLLPLQILWVNLVTDGLPGLALSVEQAEHNIMQRPPNPPDQPILGRAMGWDIAWIGLLMGIVSLVLGYWVWSNGNETDLEMSRMRTLVFTVLTLSQMGNALAVRSDRETLFQLGVFSNPVLLGSVALTFGLQMAVVYWPPLQEIFKTTSLSGMELVMCLALSTVVFWAIELQKLLRRSQR